GAGVRIVQPAVGVRCATRAVRLDVERRATPAHRPLDRVAVVGMDLLRAGRGLPARQGGMVAGAAGTPCAVRGCRRCGPELRCAPGATADRVPSLSRRRFLARATYTYAGAGVALSSYGIWSAYRLPQLTRRTLWFPD